jgi:hypothetical protein
MFRRATSQLAPAFERRLGKPSSRSRRISQRLRPAVEALESRDLPATGLSASLSNGVLRIVDLTPGDTVRVNQVAGQISVAGASITTANGSTPSISASQVNRIDLTPQGVGRISTSTPTASRDSSGFPPSSQSTSP